jgi:hypothetical protein
MLVLSRCKCAGVTRATVHAGALVPRCSERAPAETLSVSRTFQLETNSELGGLIKHQHSLPLKRFNTSSLPTGCPPLTLSTKSLHQDGLAKVLARWSCNLPSRSTIPPLFLRCKHNHNEIFVGTCRIVENEIHESVNARTETLAVLRELGPPDLVHLIKSQPKAAVKEVRAAP